MPGIYEKPIVLEPVQKLYKGAAVDVCARLLFYVISP